MYPTYLPETAVATEAESSIVIALVMFIVYFLSIGISLATYIMTSLSFYTISKKRNIKNPWLAWIPVASSWNIGTITDDIDYDRGIKRKWRALLLTLILITIAAAIVFTVIMIGMVIAIAASGAMYEGDIEASGFGGVFMGFFVALYIGTFILAIASMLYEFIYCICLYKIYEAIVPKKAVKYLLLSFLIPLAHPILLLITSKACPEKFVPTPEPAGNSFGEQL